MNWRGVRRLVSLELIEAVEAEYSVSFPEDYKKLVEGCNAGVPDKRKFSANGKGGTIERLISANQKDSPNLISSIGWVEQSEGSLITPIATCVGGDMICIDFTKSESSIVFVDYESGKRTELADNINEFLSILKD